jgi:hypothetical protein
VATRYVAKTGADSGPGTDPGSPWLTIQFALDNCTTGDDIIINDGSAQTYTETITTPAKSFTVTVASGGRHTGQRGTGTILQQTTGAHVITTTTSVTYTQKWEYLEIYQNSTTVSAECVRESGGSGNTIIFNCCLFYAQDETTGSQDGIYFLAGNAIYQLTNCMFWSFGRACINREGGDPTVNAVHCTFWGATEAVKRNGTIGMTMHNCVVKGTIDDSVTKDAGSDNAGTDTADQFIDHDATSGVTSSSQASGAWLIIQDTTADAQDLRPKQDDSFNEIMDNAHDETATYADTATDIIGTSRTYTGANLGAYEGIPGGGGGGIIIMAKHHYQHNTGSGL